MWKLIKIESLRLLRGRFKGEREFRSVTLLLFLIAAVCFALCWANYPTPESFSMMRDTISNFGKPEKYRDVRGMSFFRLGFVSLCVLLCACTGYREKKLRGADRRNVRKTTSLYLGGILCLLLTLLVPDSSRIFFWGIKYRPVHGAIAVTGIALFFIAVLRDALVVINIHLMKRLRHPHSKRKLPRSLFPFLGFVGLFSVSLSLIAIWKIRCLFDESLKFWPGEGVFSMPMWEWIAFSYLLLFMYWFPILVRRPVSNGGVSAIHSWSRVE